MKIRLVLAAATVVAVAFPVAQAGADECGSQGCLPCNGDIHTIATPVATFYVDDRTGGTPDVDHWVYMESNNRAGLQTGGQSVILGNLDADSCKRLTGPYDTLII